MEFNATFIISAISFIIFVFIMNAILYRPVIKIMEERETYINTNEENANTAREQAKSLKEEKSKKLKIAKEEASTTVANGTKAFREENQKETEEYIKEQKNKTEIAKDSLNEEAKNSEIELKKGTEDISQIISAKILEI